MKDSDTGLWLHNKLGSTDELWTPPSIASLLTVSVIDNIRLCFSSLSPPVKLKLLLGMLHLPRRTVDEVGRGASVKLLSTAQKWEAQVKPASIQERSSVRTWRS